MASREDVFREFGVASHIAQSIEFDLGRTLIAHEILQGHSRETQLPGEAFLDALRRKTLGALLRDIRDRYNLLGDLEDGLRDAIAARNHLAHGFFSAHIDDLETDSGRDAMIRHLEEMQRVLWQGHSLARAMADHLVNQLTESPK